MRTVIVCCTTPQRGLPHQHRLLKSNPGKAVYVQYGPQSRHFTWKRYAAWRNPDRLVRDWWLQTGRFIEFDRAVFTEWDVVFDADADEVFPPDGADFICNHIVYHPEDDWHWWRELKTLPPGMKPSAAGAIPFAVVVLSRRVLEAMFSNQEVLALMERNSFSELRLITIARHLGFTVGTSEALSNVRWDKLPEGSDPTRPGIWHPVKKALE